MKSKSLYIFVLAAIVLALAGCQKNELQDGGLYGDSIVRFAPSITQTTESFATKGALINEDGTAGAFDPSKSFFVSAWDNAATPTNIIPGTAGSYQEVKMLGTQWNTVYTTGGKEYAKEYLWKEDETEKTFFAYAFLPEGDVVSSIIPGAGEDPAQQLTHTVPSAASAQTDILMGFYRGDGKTGPVGSKKMTGTASIVFSHPLTAVKFKLGTIAGINPESIKFSSISIEGVYPSGKAEMTPASAGQTDPKDRFIWKNSSGSDFSAADETKEVSQTISTQPTTSAPAIGEAFLLIPQTFSADSKARIKVVLEDADDASKTLTLYYPLNTNIGTVESPAYTSWKAGYTNTYTISFTGSGYSIDGPEEYNGDVLGGRPEGALPGLFSVSANKQVYFSRGNLVATIDASGTPTNWRFATNQYDCLGEGGANQTIGTTAGDVDIFWWSVPDTNYGINGGYYNNAFIDWGNTMDNKGTWCTLSTTEWRYLFSFSTQANDIRRGLSRYGVTVVGHTNCCILYPDGYSGIKVSHGDTTSYDTAEEWSVAEKEGVVCLPAGGIRMSSIVSQMGTEGHYWSSSKADVGTAYKIWFSSETIHPVDYESTCCSVRLVTDSDNSASVPSASPVGLGQSPYGNGGTF